MRESSWRLSDDQLGLERLEERRERSTRARAIDVGNGARQREPVLERIAGARRRLRAVAEHPPAAVGAARRHRPRRSADARRRAARRRPAAAGIPDCRRSTAAGSRPSRIERAPARRRPPAPLRATRRAGSRPAFSSRPFAGLDDQRHMAERPRPLDAGGVLVDAIEHAGVAQVAIGGGEAAVDLLGAERRPACRETAASARAPGRRHPSSRRRCRAAAGSRRQMLRALAVSRSAVVSSGAAIGAILLDRPPQVEGDRIFERAFARRHVDRVRRVWP